jgi:hypothetical protein
MGYDDDECLLCYNSGYGGKDHVDDKWVCLKCLEESLEKPRSRELSYLKNCDWEYTDCFLCDTSNVYCMEIALCKDHWVYDVDDDDHVTFKDCKCCYCTQETKNTT